ncbi:origin recognition complex subunit 1 isoform X2 [Maniola jurtina]|uniref:origin recognition complex subunit 1 isoform X2 n=1 Tax=Maniola jurtina TaxID=191418 RepID=UPI001E68C182|nr:origin recognition complex subunit 1 isoform X2 [Maniola jurtina]
MPRKKPINKNVTWLSEKIPNEHKFTTFHYYKKFQFKKIVGEIGDFVLISNADAAEPDTEGGCDAAKILALYEDSSNNNNPFRAKVQWYSKPDALPKGCYNQAEPINFYNREVVEDHRPFDTDVSIETFFKKCSVIHTFTKDTDDILHNQKYTYICRYRLMPLGRRKTYLEPVFEEERKAIELLCTPRKNITPNTPTTPNSLVKRMSRVSISDKNWSVSKSDGTKLLLKRAILADKTEKDTPKVTTRRSSKSTPTVVVSKSPKSPKQTVETKIPKKPNSNSVEEKLCGNNKPKNATPKSLKSPVETPKSSKKLNKNNIEEILSMELRENSEDELPTLIIRQNAVTPKRKTPQRKICNESPKKVLVFEDEEDTNIPCETHVTRESHVTRSGRVTRQPMYYREEVLSPIKKTPTRRSAQKSSESEDDFKPLPKTPKVAKTPKTPKTPKTSIAKTPRTPRTPKTSMTKTPRSVTRRILISELTPTLQKRAHPIENIDGFIIENKSLPGRERQLSEILSFVRNNLLHGRSRCMYISGVPGTGKTATVEFALKVLKEEQELPEFQLVEVNGMMIAEPRQAYVQIYKKLTGKSVVWEQAFTLLEKRFTNPGPRRTPTVLVVDELDALCNRRQDVIYSIMEWATHNTALLTVLAIANTMDLPERALAARVASRLGLTRLSFPPYSHTQLQNIVATRLVKANVTPDALQLIARKVAAVSGDARRAISLCDRALELAAPNCAGLREVQLALEEASTSDTVRAIRCCAPAERLILRAMAAEVERTGSDETTMSRMLATATALAALDGRPYRSAPNSRGPTYSQAHALCASLSAMQLIHMERKPSEPRLMLNCSVDDVHYATKKITL